MTSSCLQDPAAHRQCIDLNTQWRARAGAWPSSTRSAGRSWARANGPIQNDIIRELARNGCGQQYVQEARRRDSARNPLSMLFGGEESDAPRGPATQFRNLPFATYRTLCVRLCDGYYFPVSFSTLPNHFQRDADQCQSQCAAPAELYYHQNPGGAVEQMVSASSQQPYTTLKSAWRYRKEFVQGCSCKAPSTSPAAERRKTRPRHAHGPASSTASLNPS